MEEVNGLSDSILDKHTLSIARDQGCRSGAHIVGQQDGGIFMAEVEYGKLANGLVAIISDFDLLIEHPWGSVGPGQGTQRHPTPGRFGTGVDQYIAMTPVVCRNGKKTNKQ